MPVTCKIKKSLRRQRGQEIYYQIFPEFLDIVTKYIITKKLSFKKGKNPYILALKFEYIALFLYRGILFNEINIVENGHDLQPS